jgi:UDP-3-O-[3-hydroxymyristoyl] glucosamine N-acyltransferase
VGANSCIDRGTYGDTLIGNDVKIDNLVQVGHNCEVGQGSVLCGNVGLAGSAVLGKFVYVGGGAGIGNKVRVGDRAMIGAYGVIKRNVEPGIHVTGDPQREIRSHLRAQAILNRLIAEKEKGRSQ